jgi:hypothetical protein
LCIVPVRPQKVSDRFTRARVDRPNFCFTFSNLLCLPSISLDLAP